MTNVPFGCMLTHVQLFATLRTIARPTPLSIEFFRQGYWSGLEEMKNGLPFPPSGDLSDPGLELMSCISCPGRRILYHSHHLGSLVVTVVQSQSHVQLFETPRTAARQASLSFTISRSLLKLKFIGSVMPSNHLILCRPFLLLPSNLSQHQVLFQ